MTLQEAHSLALKVLKQVMEEKLDENNVQLAQVSWPTPWIQHQEDQADPQVTIDKGFRILGETELKDLIAGIAA